MSEDALRIVVMGEDGLSFVVLVWLWAVCGGRGPACLWWAPGLGGGPASAGFERGSHLVSVPHVAVNKEINNKYR